MYRLLHAAFLVTMLGADVLALGSPAPIDEQKSQYAAFVEDSVCGSMETFVGFYVAFRLSGETESESKQRYREIREAWNPRTMALEDLKMNDRQADLYVELANRGGGLADKYVEVLRPQIESAAADLRARFPNERLKPELSRGQLVGVTAAVSSEQERIQGQQEKAARIMCAHLTRSSVEEELGKAESSGGGAPKKSN